MRSGTKGRKGPESNKITVIAFKEHFERVSKERYVEDSSVIARVIERVNHLRGVERARNPNKSLNVMPDKEKIESAMEEMK